MYRFFWLIMMALLFMGCKSQPHSNAEGNGIMNIDINKNAPVIGNNEIIINAPMEKIIKTLSDINNWVNWRKTVTKSELLDPLAENASFKWTADGLNYKSRIHTYKNNTFGWTGKTTGAYAVHNWYFTENNGTTTVKVEESLEGFFIKLTKKSMQNKLNNIIINDLKDLKEECEK